MPARSVPLQRVGSGLAAAVTICRGRSALTRAGRDRPSARRARPRPRSESSARFSLAGAALPAVRPAGSGAGAGRGGAATSCPGRTQLRAGFVLSAQGNQHRAGSELQPVGFKASPRQFIHRRFYSPVLSLRPGHRSSFSGSKSSFLVEAPKSETRLLCCHRGFVGITLVCTSSGLNLHHQKAEATDDNCAVAAPMNYLPLPRARAEMHHGPQACCVFPGTGLCSQASVCAPETGSEEFVC